MMPASTYLAFDLEISKSIPDNFGDWRRFRPLGISCAATLASDGSLTHWYSQDEAGGYAARMSRADAHRLVGHLQEAVLSGNRVLTWNGLGFDFDILAEESGEFVACRELALEHVDMMFHVFCLAGHPLGLDKAASGSGVKGKPAGMSGALAPLLWQQGEYQQVLDYVAQDVRTTLELAQAVERTRRLRWVSQSGRRQELYLPEGWLSVRQAMLLPEPVTSHLRSPWKRSRFTGWLSRPGG